MPTSEPDSDPPRPPPPHTLTVAQSKLASAEGVDFPPALRDLLLGTVRTLEPGGFSWLHDDLVNGGRMELEALLGTVVRSAAAHDLRVPACQTVYALLKPWAVRNGRQAG